MRIASKSAHRALFAVLVTSMATACGVPLDDAIPLDPNKSGDSEDEKPGFEKDESAKISAPVVAGCIDGDFSETIIGPSVDIEDLADSYTSTNARAALEAALERRYPIGAEVLKRSKGDPQCEAFYNQLGQGFGEDLSTAVIIVHECGHMVDGALIKPGKSGYFLNPSTIIEADNKATMPRGTITGDEYSMPSCDPSSMDDEEECESYRSTYLEELYDQPLELLMEEQVQYVGSLAVAYAFVDYRPDNQRASDRDGILTFLWYMQRYLKMLRAEEPEEYEAVAEDPNWQKLILSNWGRAWLYLSETAGIQSLDLRGEMLQEKVLDPTLLGEIQAIRKRTGCVE